MVAVYHLPVEPGVESDDRSTMADTLERRFAWPAMVHLSIGAREGVSSAGSATKFDMPSSVFDSLERPVHTVDSDNP
jgi:hypothetical protein